MPSKMLTGIVEGLDEVASALASPRGPAEPPPPTVLLPALASGLLALSRPGALPEAAAALLAALLAAPLLGRVHVARVLRVAGLAAAFSAAATAPLALAGKPWAMVDLSSRAAAAAAAAQSVVSGYGWACIVSSLRRAGLPAGAAASLYLLPFQARHMLYRLLSLTAALEARSPRGLRGLRTPAEAVAALLDGGFSSAARLELAIRARGGVEAWRAGCRGRLTARGLLPLAPSLAAAAAALLRLAGAW